MIEQWLHFERETIRKMAKRRRSTIDSLKTTEKSRPLTAPEQQCKAICVERYHQLTQFLLAVTSADSLLLAIRIRSRATQNGGKTQGT